MSHETGGYIVCSNVCRARIVHMYARELGFDIPFPLTFSEFLLGKYYAKGIKGLLFDDIDDILENISKVPVNAITMTIEVDE